jgi:hypothetical protein
VILVGIDTSTILLKVKTMSVFTECSIPGTGLCALGLVYRRQLIPIELMG